MSGDAMHNPSNGRSIADIISTIQEELIQFSQTRFKLFKVRTQQKLALLKIAGILAAIAVVLIATGYLLITLSH